MKQYDINFPPLISTTNVYGQIQYIIRIEIKQILDGYEWESIELPRGVWNKSIIISSIIRSRYSTDDVEAIINNVLSDPLDETRMAEYKTLQEWRKYAKEQATELMAWADEHGLGDLIQNSEDNLEDQDFSTQSNKPDGILQLAQTLVLAKKQVVDLSDEDALEVSSLFPIWQDNIGKEVKVGDRLYYNNRLWKVLQQHTIQDNWTPDITPSLYTEIVIQQEGEPEIGTLENPIPYNGNMELIADKYYSQDGVIYLCIRDSGNPVYHPLSALVGLYVQVVS